ncbi:MAG: hypothetical protein ABI164_02945, partial [Acidobacteriaceae bacterium]
ALEVDRILLISAAEASRLWHHHDFPKSASSRANPMDRLEANFFPFESVGIERTFPRIRFSKLD